MNRKEKAYSILLVLILITAAILRFWNYFHLPFMHDELSAMSRTVYDNFRDLIRYGVVENDTHPAGVQVFMYYWTHWFGDAEWIVKLPFVLAGLASVWIAYLVAKLWFNSTTAVLTAAYLASLQLFVLYSQIARPYASGLFLTLLMVLFWSRYILKGHKIADLLLFVLFAALSSYNHHFSLMFAALVGFSGLWFVKSEKRKAYILAGIAIFVLYIPHLPVFFAQLQKGGIGGWLGKPSPWFPFEFLDWLLHYSFWAAATLGFVFVFFLFSSERNPVSGQTKKIRQVMVIWFLTPIIIGYAYSVIVDPVLQYSLMIFSTPYLFMFLFSFIGKLNIQQVAAAVILILLVNILTLVFKREHYKILYKQPFEEVVKSAVELNMKYPGDVFMMDDYIPYFNEYYFRKYKKEIPYYTVRNKNLNIVQFDSVVNSIKQNRVITCALNKDYFQVMKKHFPYFINYDYGFTFEEYTFSRAPADTSKVIQPKVLALTDFKSKTGPLKVNRKHILTNTTGNRIVYHQLPDEKYGPSSKFQVSDFTDNIYRIVDISVRIKPLSDSCSALLVVQINRKGKKVYWKGVNFKSFGLNTGKWQDVFLTVNLQDALKNKMSVKDVEFKFFIWNPNREDFLISEISIEMRKGNPYRYALFFDFKDK